MASLLPGLASGTADAVSNGYAADASKTVVDNMKADTNLKKGGRDHSVQLTGG